VQHALRADARIGADDDAGGKHRAGADRRAFADRHERTDVNVRPDPRARIDDGAGVLIGPLGRGASSARSNVASAKRGEATATMGLA